jgi:glutamate synthase domain-containing protein 3
MSGGLVVVRPPDDAGFVAADAASLGNCALYGATGGRLLVSGRAGDRFAVRNSGAVAVIDHVGMHGCGYMTGGTVVVLGETSHNLGSGMTGGELFCPRTNEAHLNTDYLAGVHMSADDEARLRDLLEQHALRTASETSRALLDDWSRAREGFGLYLPKRAAADREARRTAA